MFLIGVVNYADVMHANWKRGDKEAVNNDLNGQDEELSSDETNRIISEYYTKTPSSRGVTIK